MTIKEAQQKVDEWSKTTGIRYFSELTNMAILTEEVGEVARLMSRTYGDQSFKESDKNQNLSEELADVLWVLICVRSAKVKVALGPRSIEVGGVGLGVGSGNWIFLRAIGSDICGSEASRHFSASGDCALRMAA